jgi:hypothetical protein
MKRRRCAQGGRTDKKWDIHRLEYERTASASNGHHHWLKQNSAGCDKCSGTRHRLHPDADQMAALGTPS